MTWGAERGAADEIGSSLAARGAAFAAIEADLADVRAPARIFDEAERLLGGVTALVMSHCESVDSGLLDTTIESFDRHFAVNARAVWLLIRGYGRRFRGVHANVVNPGPVDTGWMSDEVRARCLAQTPLGRLGMPQDTAHLVSFLCSRQGQWINGQLLKSNGGFS
ncbi:SDR family oxidoreductase [Microbispora hainanensis]|uniref:SDR family oxidoreductase n=1 Tax=Microbispora hainanensis TaxID=568844 RepID=UPI002E2C2F07|nr:SDR family oxidoreductase [Microbispora hainanensis]